MAKKRQRPHGTGCLFKRKPDGPWLAKFFTHDGRRLERSTRTTCRDTAQRIMARWVDDQAQRRTGLVDPRMDRFATEGRKALASHLDDWKASLMGKGATQAYADLSEQRVRAILDATEAKFWKDLDANRVNSYLADLRRPKVETKSDGTQETRPGLSIESTNHYLRRVKQFARWMFRTQRASSNPLECLGLLNSRTDRRHERRALSADELVRLLDTTQKAATKYGVTGFDRAMLYRVCVESGLRSNELRSLTVRSFKLDADPPTVTVAAAYSKRRREDVQPIRPELADALRRHFAGKLAGAKAFAMPGRSRVSRMFKADLEAAGISPRDDAGRVADFHSLRHTFISNLARGGVHPKLAQQLARHSTITLTMDRYTHTVLGDLSDALAALPDLQTDPAERTQQKATGTDGKASGDSVTPTPIDPRKTPLHIPRQFGRETAERGGTRRNEPEATTEGGDARKPLSNTTQHAKRPMNNANLNKRPHGDSNPGSRLEKPVSWASRRWGRTRNQNG